MHTYVSIVTIVNKRMNTTFQMYYIYQIVTLYCDNLMHVKYYKKYSVINKNKSQ